MKVAVTFTVSLPIAIKKKQKYYVSSCPILDVWSQGETREKAVSNLREALQLFLIDCYERGTLDKVLKECGFTAVRRLPSKKHLSTFKHEIDVPLPFLIDEHLARCPR
ncbi:MAG: type II toxin-antitoxin system HicB family antitoxin [Candidatus Hydrothermarchaeota archaeon]